MVPTLSHPGILIIIRRTLHLAGCCEINVDARSTFGIFAFIKDIAGSYCRNILLYQGHIIAGMSFFLDDRLLPSRRIIHFTAVKIAAPPPWGEK